MSLDERERPPHKITHVESARLNLSIHFSKEDLKKRWREINSEKRIAIREEWGEFINNSYPFEEGDVHDFNFLDYFKSW